MGRDRERHQRPLGALGLPRFHESGQATVEFAVLMGAFLVMVSALAALWRQVEAGVFVQHALVAASHHLQLTAPGFLADIFLY